MSEKDATRDTTVKRIDSALSPRGAMGQHYLASGKSLSMRLWEIEPTGEGERSGSHGVGAKRERERDYETIGYVLDGTAELLLEDATIRLAAGDSWVVPAGARHTYRILEPFRAIEATSPPARVHGRDEPPQREGARA